MVLGAIVEQVSGMPFDAYVSQHIFTPAGMQGAGFFAKDEPVPNVAVGYTRFPGADSSGGWRNNLFLLPVKGNSAGSAQASVTDLFHFDSALREHVLLSPATTQWFFGGAEPTAGAETDAGARSATGALSAPESESVASATSERVGVGMGIAGGAPGVSAVLESDGDLAVIVLANLDEPVAESIARAIFRPVQRALVRLN
jgi:CubicO group peptidase (beta-lactamase class C family)